MTPAGELLIANDGGQLFLLSVVAASALTTDTSDQLDLAKASVAAFLAATSELPADGDLESDLVLTDGARTWEADDLATVTEVEPTDPGWLQITAAMNKARSRDA